MSKHNQRNVNLSALFRPGEAKKLKRLAEKAGLTVSTFMRVELRRSLSL